MCRSAGTVALSHAVAAVRLADATDDETPGGGVFAGLAWWVAMTPGCESLWALAAQRAGDGMTAQATTAPAPAASRTLARPLAATRRLAEDIVFTAQHSAASCPGTSSDRHVPGAAPPFGRSPGRSRPLRTRT